MTTVLRIVAALILDERGRALMVRKTGTTAFMQPGGKIEPLEEPDAALARELHEELGLVLLPEQLTLVGRFSAAAANEADTEVDALIYDAPLLGLPVVAAEIAELAWVDPGAPGELDLAPLSRDILLPLLLGRR
jgi:8-oxo-dGTP diphosphatase